MTNVMTASREPNGARSTSVAGPAPEASAAPLAAARSPATAKAPSSNVQKPTTMPVTLNCWCALPRGNHRPSTLDANERRCQDLVGAERFSLRRRLCRPENPIRRTFQCQWSGYGLAALVRALAPGQQAAPSREPTAPARQAYLSIARTPCWENVHTLQFPR